MTQALAGRAVLVTRPAGLGERLAAMLGERGAEAILIPAIEILPPGDPARIEATIARLQEFDLAVFVSPSAASMADQAVRARRAWPARLAVAAVGTGTARALAERGFSDVIAPAQRGDSEALAALPALSDVRGRRIVIFRGEGGRETLRKALLARGAIVEYCECYRRAMPRIDTASLIRRWQARGVHAVSITSSEGLRNLAALLGAPGHPLLLVTPVFVPHARVGDAARMLGVERVIVTDPGDEPLVRALEVFFAKV